jgi:hypothetical protein
MPDDATVRETDAILFSADPDLVVVDDAIRHLAEHEELYWEVGFRIVRDNFSYPLFGFIHIKGGGVEYRATIRDILPSSPVHYEDEGLAAKVKPEAWIRDWRENTDEYRLRWKYAFVITEIVPFSYETCLFIKSDGTRVQRPPESYVRVLSPDRSGAMTTRVREDRIFRPGSVPENALQELLARDPEKIEPGLKLESREKSTSAGRFDLLCRDANGDLVVVELKRMQGTDQVVGQIARYIGWLKETYPTEKVRGIIVVGKKDQALSYAVKAIPDVQVKEFKLQIVDADA